MFKPLTNTELSQLLKYDAYFIGVFPRNLLPLSVIRKPPLTLIVNTDTSNLKGQHWVAVYIDQYRRGEYFDSLAQPIPKHISLWLSRFSCQWNYVLRPYIDPPIQDIFSQTCGAFTFYYVHQRPLCDSFRDILKPFSTSFARNDDYVISYMLKHDCKK